MRINHNVRKMIAISLLVGLSACGDDDICRSGVRNPAGNTYSIGVLAIH